jgi:hypothetical protein
VVKTWPAQSRGWKASATSIAVIALIIIAAACGGGGDKESSVTAAQICGATAQPAVNIDSPEIIEASGIAESRRDNDIVFVHNDSGDTARFFAVDRTGRLLATFSLTGTTAIDWEDMAIGPGPEKDVSYLYLADIGDNEAQRPEVAVYRVREPEVTKQPDTPSAQEIANVDTLTFRYPDHPHDAETFMVDPLNGDLVIVTKELATGISIVFRAPSPDGPSPSMPPGTPPTLEQVGQIDFTSLHMAATPSPDAPTLVRAVPLLPTGGDISPDGSLIAIRTYGAIFVWSRAKGASVAAALAGQPCEAPSAIEQQGEAIAFDADGRGYVTTSEGASPPLHHFVVAR